MIAFFVFANFIFLIYWAESRRRTARRIQHHKQAKKLFWRVMRAHASCSGIPAPTMVATFDNLVQAGQLLYLK
jgi:hypothetical protein